MKSRYHINIQKQHKLWCQMNIDSTWAEDVLADLVVRYPKTEGFSIEIYQAHESRRILETSHSGLKTLAVEYEMTAVERE
ncbi:MAG TPA: hypothetical protein EYM37_08040 [Methylophaga aminisulfidivorans]|jgi:hypothetical protein|uniref:hypothetical protein n=1 Tax=Methylophaga TaxID=40222 RepID=UPI00176CEE01|nr:MULTISPECIES: hypothetical protein [Methylophaga]HIC47572.1 hypothetical protein [Methylophaga sp.]HIM39881.1 hypothetical protein [Methylophaga aminisulfidivorans]